MRFIQRYESTWFGTPFPPFCEQAADSRLWWTEYIVFLICPIEPRPRVIENAHWNGLRSAGLGSLINDHENCKIVIGLDKENNNSARASRFLDTYLPSLLKFPIMCCCYLFDFLTLMFDIFIDGWVKLFSALFFTWQRMRTEYNCPVVAGKPKVAFRETIGKEARYELNVTPMLLFQLIDLLHSSVSFMSNREL